MAIEIVPEPTTDTDPQSLHAHDHTDGDAPDVEEELEELFEWATAHPTARIRALAERTAQGLTSLAEHRDRARAVDAATTRLIEAQLMLAQAEADLRVAKSGTGPVPATAAPSRVPVADPGPEQRREEGRRARAWAVRTGLVCPDRGLVPKHVLDAYRKANPGDAVRVVR